MNGNKSTRQEMSQHENLADQKPQFTLLTLMVLLTIFAISLVPISIWQQDGILPAILIGVSLTLIYFRATGCLIAIWVSVLVIGMLSPFQNVPRAVAKRTFCLNNMRQIQIAVLNYHSAHGHFPPAYTVDADGNPLHSWRTLILPYLEQQALYKQIDFSRPWDHPVNARLASEMPDVYRCPSDKHLKRGDVTTSYVAVIGLETMWPPGGKHVSEFDITDGPPNTICVIESDANRMNWMSPHDILYSQLIVLTQKGNGALISSQHTGGAQVSMADGSCHFVSQTVPAKMIQAALTINGQETVDLDQ